MRVRILFESALFPLEGCCLSGSYVLDLCPSNHGTICDTLLHVALLSVTRRCALRQRVISEFLSRTSGILRQLFAADMPWHGRKPPARRIPFPFALFTCGQLRVSNQLRMQTVAVFFLALFSLGRRSFRGGRTSASARRFLPVC